MAFRDAETRRLAEAARETWGEAVATWQYPYVLAADVAGENLLADVRESALAYFEKHRIAWWLSQREQSERKGRSARRLPTGHLNSSQVACVNHLEPARLDRTVALAVARRLDPRVAEVRDTGEGGYVAFEWIGEKNYLGEAGARTRGANITSLDAIMRVTLDTGADSLIAIEWKYTESYGKEHIATSRRGTDRVSTYRAHLESETSPIVAGEPARLFYEPYYQLMRQTLLAALYVADPETPETEWVHIHVIPAANTALRRRVRDAAPLLVGDLLEETWRSALKQPNRYRIVEPRDAVPDLDEVPRRWRAWRTALADRYGS